MLFRIFDNVRDLTTSVDKDEIKPLYQYVYVVEIDNGMIKIGITNNPVRRYKELFNHYKLLNLKLKRIAITQPIENAAYIEELLHLSFCNYYHYNGINFETYNIDFQGFIDIYFPAVVHFWQELHGISI